MYFVPRLFFILTYVFHLCKCPFSLTTIARNSWMYAKCCQMQSAACWKYAKMFMVLLCACTFFSPLCLLFFSRSFSIFKDVEGALFLSSEPEGEDALQKNAKWEKKRKMGKWKKTRSIDEKNASRIWRIATEVHQLCRFLPLAISRHCAH